MGHPKETDKTGMGSRKRWNGSERKPTPRTGPFTPRFAPLRKVSSKQRKRTKTLQQKKAIIWVKHVEIYGHAQCEIGRNMWNRGTPANCAGQLVVDHVNTRNTDNPDAYMNLQLCCYFHNGGKGSERKDYRSTEMIAAMKMLDEKDNP